MGVIRLLRMSKPLGLGLSNEISSDLAVPSMVSRPREVMCLAKVGLSSENPPGSGGGERISVAAKAAGDNSACVLVSEPKTDGGVDLAFLKAYAAVSNGVDLACFAGAIFLSSASIFLLSKIAVARAEAKS